MTHRLDVRRGLGLILIMLGLALPLIYWANQAAQPAPRSTLVPTEVPATETATPIAEHLIPTVAPTTAKTPGLPTGTAKPMVTDTDSSTSRVTKTATRVMVTIATRAATPSQVATATQTPPAPVASALPPVVITGARQRFGIGVSLPAPFIARLADLGAGWFLDWNSLASSGRPAGPEYIRMVRVPRGQPRPDLATLADIAQRSPGSLWLIGNEPDVIWQDNATPEQYVQVYHDVYATLKQADPTSRIAIAGVTQPSPLRLQYLDRILALYWERFGQDMPIDVWNVHNFILPERRGDWGAEIPPGLTANSGLIVEIDDHDNLERFKEQIVDFRRWMAERGFRDKELIVSEYGVLMYEDLGFDYARVRTFMLGTFDYFLSATDGAIGLPSDGNRLVQRWCWYSLSDGTYPTGNLIDRVTGQLTALGRDFADYIASH
ncbi:MAG: hypothetical protein KA765_11575 [Thermoflexales bacterium]|nr:hypothetical protein [Thermoflexales bacterium]